MPPPVRSPVERAREALLGARRRWWVTFGVLFVMTATWSLATPLMASPDEPAHTVKAAAVVRGQLFGTPTGPPSAGVSPDVAVRVPRVFAKAGNLPGCYAFKPRVPAACAPALRSDSTVVTEKTSAGRYEPLYYAVVGLPSLVLRSAVGIRCMRLVGALLCCAFLASAFESARTRRSRLAVVGVAAACTPMVVFLCGVVNPNSLEIAAALCLWTSGLALVHEDGAQAPSGRLVARLGLSASVLVQVRSLSLLWTALIGLALLAVSDRQRLLALVHRRDVRVWAAVFAASTAFAGFWVLAFHPLAQIATPPAHPLSTSAVLRTSIGKFTQLAKEMIGVVGWTDTFPPAVTFYGWLVVVAVLLGIGLARAKRRVWVTTVLVVAATVVLPVVIESSQADKVGFVWQGRYTLPLAVGIPVLAATAVPDELALSLGARLAGLLVAVMVVAQGAMFVVALRRYAVGVSGPLDYFAGAWRPPFGAPLVTAVFGLALCCYAALLLLPARPWRPARPQLARGEPANARLLRRPPVQPRSEHPRPVAAQQERPHPAR